MRNCSRAPTQTSVVFQKSLNNRLGTLTDSAAVGLEPWTEEREGLVRPYPWTTLLDGVEVVALKPPSY